MTLSRPNIRAILNSAWISLIINLGLVYVCYFACRIVFYLCNLSAFSETTFSGLITILRGAWFFDTAGIMYTNALYILLLLFPFHFKEHWNWYAWIVKFSYIIPNAVGLFVNLVDVVAFPYRGQRATWGVFQEFGNDTNLGGIFWLEALKHWYLVVILAGMIYFLWRFYRRPMVNTRPWWLYYLIWIPVLPIAAFFAISGMRGSLITTASRPISPGNAHQYVKKAHETALVLNTPFSMLRTIGEILPPAPKWFDRQTLDSIYTPIHEPTDSTIFNKRNIVILIVESFGQEFIGALNKDLDGGTYKGYTPFTDSLLQESAYWEQMIANTGFSIDAMPAILASIPRMDIPYPVTPFALNATSSLPDELKTHGYYSAFFHGAENGSLGLQAMSVAQGFDAYFGRDEYNADNRFDGTKDYDGKWGIWDEPFLQFFAVKLGELPQPFLASVFTLSSHHPFRIPEQYKDVFLDEGKFEMHKCIRYSDHALRLFFETARKQPWYNNTIFVLTADHASQNITHPEYKTYPGERRAPIIFFDPSGEFPRGKQQGVAQQIDIMPTLLNYLGHDHGYIAFGKDLLAKDAVNDWAFNFNGMGFYIKGNYMIVFDWNDTIGLYNYILDPLNKNNLKEQMPELAREIDNERKAFIQSYMERMEANDLRYKTHEK